MGNGKNGKIAGTVVLAGAVIAAVVGLFEVADRIAWADAVEKEFLRIEGNIQHQCEIYDSKLEKTRILLAQTIKGMQRSQNQSALSNLHIQKFQWESMLINETNPEKRQKIQNNLDRIDAQIEKEENAEKELEK